MTTDLSANCTERFEELSKWFESLPPGVAKMEIVSSPKRYPLEVEIKPLLNPEAASILIGIDRAVFDVWAGGAYLSDIACSERSPADYCQSIVSGGLTETEYMWAGVLAYETAQLLVGDELVTERSYPFWGCLLAPIRSLLRGKRERVTRYPPYD